MSDRRSLFRATTWLPAVALTVLAGCASGPETDFSFSQGKSLNGTSVLSSALQAEGHEVEAAIRASDEVANWAQGIIRFSPYPGPPDRAEATWYQNWLSDGVDRWLIYVARDFDASLEYWQSIVDQLAGNAAPEERQEAERARDLAADWVNHLPPKASKPADAAHWFETEKALKPPRVCARLSGRWAMGVDAAAARVWLHEPIHTKDGDVLLAGDDKPIVIDKLLRGGNRLLLIANGSFLLNGALVANGRLPLVRRLFEWIGPDSCQIALLEGDSVMEAAATPPTLWDLARRIVSFRWIAAQMGIAALAAALARAPRLGRPHDGPDASIDRPADHARALGALLARTGSVQTAQELIERYRQWRYPVTGRRAADE
jgi:hypothetical protein